MLSFKSWKDIKCSFYKMLSKLAVVLGIIEGWSPSALSGGRLVFWARSADSVTTVDLRSKSHSFVVALTTALDVSEWSSQADENTSAVLLKSGQGPGQLVQPLSEYFSCVRVRVWAHVAGLYNFTIVALSALTVSTGSRPWALWQLDELRLTLAKIAVACASCQLSIYTLLIELAICVTVPAPELW